MVIICVMDWVLGKVLITLFTPKIRYEFSTWLVIHFLWILALRICYKIKQYSLFDIFLSSHHFINYMPKIFVVIVRRNSCLITLGSGRTKFPENFRYQLTQEKSLGFAKGRGNLLGGGGGVDARESQNSRMYRAGSYSILDISDVQS